MKSLNNSILTLLAVLLTPIVAPAFERGTVERFATLPAGEAHPEGICVDREGNVYVVTVAANKPDTSGGTLIVFDPNGKHLRTVTINGSTPWLLDLRFHPQTGELLVIDYKDAKVLSVDPQTGDSSVFMTVTGEHPGLDGMTFDNAGNLYVTNAHEGMIWKVGPSGALERSGSKVRCSSPPGHRPASARMVWRSTTCRRRCSSPTPRTIRS